MGAATHIWAWTCPPLSMSSATYSRGKAHDPLPPGCPVEYLSRSHGAWIPATVRSASLGSSSFTYQLDVQPMAPAERVRPLPQGTLVRYVVADALDCWLPATVEGFDAAQGIYELTDAPLSVPHRVPARQVRRSEVQLATAGLSGRGGAPAAVEPVTEVPRRGQAYHGSASDVLGTRRDRSELLSTLLELGFDAAKAHAAVERCSSVEAAVELITANGVEFPERGREHRYIRCPLCLEDRRLEDVTTLDCGHQFCSSCFGMYCESKIREGQVQEDELACPGRKEDTTVCGCTVTTEQARGAVSEDIFVRFLEFRARAWEPARSDGKLVRCPTPHCCQFVVPREAERACCPRCRGMLCAACGHTDHSGVTCDQARATREHPEAERELEALILARGWQRCPVCGAPTELEHGCYFMRCPSESCRGRVHFCYLCGERLQEEDHRPGRSLVHFPRGPYNCECVNTTEEEYRRRHSAAGAGRPGNGGALLDGLQAGVRRLLEF
uniref:RBR-type E3 ubiquitin transferase n=1 Tax=Alexandrium monilatum TaxID=311494 RepID=A0A6T0RJ23_9DINO